MDTDLTIDQAILDHFLASFGHQLPRHVAIIMDGNGRWAKRHGKERLLGHHAGAKAVRRVVEASRYLGLENLTLYAFSTQNWGRPQSEVDGLMHLFVEYIAKEKERLVENGIRTRVIGDRHRLPSEVITQIKELEEATANLRSMTLQVAVSYGGREEIVAVARNLCTKVKTGQLSPEEVNNDTFAKHLYTGDLPDPDLLIRTSGEKRVSNFLLWQMAYAELYFTDLNWPDFDEEALVMALEEYTYRERRFGLRTDEE